ncbi:MAG: DUF4845 domain-containing protein [Gammaproteobacteria bacterium]|nr:DUF4845 domain-containing protein [Gammaproteobacteria bacterium]
MNRHSQQGLTTIGWILVIGIFGLIVVSGFKVLPMYMEYYQVRSIMESIVTDDAVNARSKRDLWAAINRRLQINSIRDLKKEDFSFTRKNDTTIITADYEVRKPYIAELFIGAHFVYSVEIKR